tara:strand:+ start:16391 stop:17323 length:933 start_codon:yes stop_codon:yes gene_type:complete
MRLRFLAAAAVLILCLLPLPAQAFCDMHLRNLSNITFRGGNGYDVFATGETGQTVFVRVRHSKSDACSYFLTFSQGQSGSYDRALSGPGTADLHYQLYDTPSKSNVLKQIPEATSSEVLAGTFTTTDAETQEHSYYFVLPPGQMVKAGDYWDNITVRLYEGTLSSYTQRDQSSFSVEGVVKNTLQMCVVGCGAPFDPFAKSRTMAFGALHAGDMREIDLLVRGNVDYEVMFRSDNKGVMARTSGHGEVPYAFALNGAAVDLTSGRVTVALGGSPTTIDGDRYTLTATIGNLAGAAPGTYQDNIAITVRSR